MLTVRTEIPTADEQTNKFMTQHLDENPGTTDRGHKIAPQSVTVIWDVEPKGDVIRATATKIKKVQSGAASGHSPRIEMVPKDHIDEMTKAILFDFDIMSSEEIEFKGVADDEPARPHNEALQVTTA